MRIFNLSYFVHKFYFSSDAVRFWWAQIKMRWNERPKNGRMEMAQRHCRWRRQRQWLTAEQKLKRKVKAKNCYRNEACRRHAQRSRNWSEFIDARSRSAAIWRVHNIAHLRRFQTNLIDLCKCSTDSSERWSQRSLSTSSHVLIRRPFDHIHYCKLRPRDGFMCGDWLLLLPRERALVCKLFDNRN